MSVTAEILVKHDFFELDNYEKSEAFVKQTIDKVKFELSINEDHDHFQIWGYYDEDNKWSDIQFSIPLIDVSVHLRKGHWCVWTRDNYCQVTNKQRGRLHLIDDAFDVARALGQNDVWLCNEFVEEEFEEATLDEILTAASKRWGITEYPYSKLMQNEDNVFPAPANFYHYNFAESRKEFDSLCAKCGKYTPTIQNLIGGSYVRVVKDSKLNLLDSNYAPIFDEGFDNIYKIIGKEFVCGRGTKNALFGNEAVQLTEFVMGEFEWEWPDTLLRGSERILYLNHEAKIKIMATYHTYNNIEYQTLPYKSILVKRKPAKCPACKGNVVPIVYGEPSIELGKKAMRKEIVLGGCIMNEHAANWECVECSTRFCKTNKDGGLE